MDVFTNVAQLQKELEKLKSKGTSIGFVPTMGALHDGHLSIIEKSKKYCDVTLVSIYINPLQFNNSNDYRNYPIQTDEDIKKLEESDCNILFLPSQKEMQSTETAGSFDLGTLGKIMEGHYRPGHLQGMVSIVKRFFELIRPDKAFFGEKDFQQLAVVRKLVNSEKMDVEIIKCSTKREASGLAMSSRNLLLSEDEKEEASKIYKTLVYARRNTDRLSPLELKIECAEMIAEGNIKVEYFEILDENSLENIDSWEDSKHPRAFVAAYLGKVRLIDNMSLID